MMIIVNYAHPLTIAQQGTIESLTALEITAIHHYLPQFDITQPILPQIERLVQQTPITSYQWQTEPILINPPGLAPAATTLLAYLHALMGHFPTLIRIAPVPDSTPTQFVVAELVNLQAIRDQARHQRI